MSNLRSTHAGRATPDRISIGFFLILASWMCFAAVPSDGWGAKRVDSFICGSTVAPGLGGTCGEIRDVAVYEGTASNPAPAGFVGDVYAVDRGNNRIQRFSSAGVFELAFGRDVIASGKAGDLGNAFERCVVAADCKAGSTGTSTDGPAGEFSNPQGVAVNQDTGHVYVWDRSNRRVQEFDRDGAFVRTWGGNVVASGAPNDAGTGFEVCDTTAGNAPSDCQQGAPGTADGVFGSIGSSGHNGMAISPTTGDVFAIDPGNRRVQQFTATGGFVRAFGTASEFGSNHPSHVAVDADGVVYARDGNVVERYDLATLSFGSAIEIPSGLPSSGTSGLEVDHATGNLLVAKGDVASNFSGVHEIEIPSAFADPVTTVVDTHQPDGGFTPRGLGIDSGAGRLYLSTSTGGNRIVVLDDDGAPPALVTLLPPSDVGSRDATLSATINPNGVGLETSYRFEISKDGVNWVNVGPETDIGDGTDPVPVSQSTAAAGIELEPNTLYRLRVVVTKELGAGVTTSAEQTFATDALAPDVTLLGPTASRSTSVGLQARIGPNGSPTTYRFEYGTTTGYGQTAPAPDGNAGAGGAAKTVIQIVGGLQPATTYHYRVVAENPIGVTASPDRTFTTRSPTSGGQQRNYELVSPAVKQTGPGVGGHGSQSLLDGEVGMFSGLASPDGERFLSPTNSGPVLVDDAAAVFVDNYALGERTDQGWVNRSLANRRNYASAITPFLDLSGANRDLSLMVTHNSGSTAFLFPEMVSSFATDSAPYYLRDWAGNWELVAPTDPAQARPSTNLASAFDPDGTAVAFTDEIRGMLGAGDASLDQLSGRTTYLQDVSAGVSDSFPGDGVRSLVGTCTGSGADRTSLPAIDDNGTDAGPPGSGSVFADFTSGSTTVTVIFGGNTDNILPGHYVTHGLIPSGTRVVSVDSATTFTISNATEGSAGGFAQMTVGQDATKLADDFVAAQPCPPPAAGRDDALTSKRGAALTPNTTGGELENVMTPGGSRLFFMSPDPRDEPASCASATGAATDCPAQLYVRQRGEDGGPVVRWISRSEVAGQAPGLLGPAYFEGASVDGDKVFFRTTSPLTADDPNGGAPVPGGVTAGTASESSWDLYMYDFPDTPGADPGSGDLTRISAGPTGAADANLGATGRGSSALRFVSDDGRRLYFTSAAAIPGVGAADNGTVTSASETPGTANLYLYDAAAPSAERWRFVAQLPKGGQFTIAECATTADGVGQTRTTQSVAGGDVIYALKDDKNCVRGTADGAFITLWTDGRLTADDPDETSGDVYGFDAALGELTRLSAPQGGAGGSYLCDQGTQNDRHVRCHGDTGFQFNPVQNPRVPDLLGVVTEPETDGDRVAFFQSRSRLVAADVNEAMDVYEWRNGDLSLVSTGTGSEGAFYSGNSASGRDVFVVTRNRLTWEDIDGVRDVYDARVGGGFDEPQPPVLCGVLAGDCQSASGPISEPAPSSGRAPASGNADPGVRGKLTIAGLSAKARRRAARSGVLPVRVRTSRAGVVRVLARAKIGKRTRRVAGRKVRVRKAGAVTVKLRLNRAAKRRLRSGRVLRVTLRVASQGARTRTATVGLKRGKRS